MRLCLYIDASMHDTTGVFHAAIIRENEPGYYPSDAPLGCDLTAARKYVDEYNTILGHTADVVGAIVASSFAAGNTG